MSNNKVVGIISKLLVSSNFQKTFTIHQFDNVSSNKKLWKKTRTKSEKSKLKLTGFVGSLGFPGPALLMALTLNS